MLLSLQYTLSISVLICFIFVFILSKPFVKKGESNKRIFDKMLYFSVFNGVLLNAVVIYFAPNVSVINKDLSHCKKYYIGFNNNLKMDGKYVYNESSKVLTLKQFLYSLQYAQTMQKLTGYSSAPKNVPNEKRISIPCHQFIEVEVFPDYYFEEPPQKIKVGKYSRSERWGIY